MSAIDVIPRTLGLLALLSLAAASARGEDPPARPPFDPEAVFDRADEDADGKLSRKEFQFVVANAPRLRDDPQRADRVFGMLDADRNGWLSPAEFQRLAAMRGGSPPARPPTPAAGSPEKAAGTMAGRSPTADQLAFFEAKVRPVLVQQCYECHSAQAKKVKGGLLLDTREGARRGGEQGPAVVPGDPEASLLVQAVRYKDENLRMPPKHRLSGEVVADLERWVKSGAADPRNGKAVVRSEVDIEKGRRFWAFQPPRAVAAPSVRDAAWPRSDVDRFLLAAMEARGARPVGDADRAALLRRLGFDLTGLPPTPAEVEAFLADESPAAVEKVVDRLLGSPAFGERWGRHWLDVARFAESSGKQVNLNYPHAWRYRDYVIDSFNADKPFNRFAMEQVAGDLMPARDDRQRAERAVATGFLADRPSAHNNERSRLQFDLELADEQIDATTQAFLGLTVACARCHDHKFDPIPQRDYYALAGIFRSTETLFGTTLVIQNNRRTTELLELPAAANPPMIGQRLSPDARADLERQLESMRAREREIARGGRAATQGNGEYLRLQTRIHLAESRLASFDAEGKPRPLAMAARDRSSPADSPLYTRGEPDAPGEVVPRGLPQVLVAGDGQVRSPGSGRLELAEFLGSDRNPLTARVWVNRVWLHLFGQGLVPTPDSFGASGTPPTNPPLLDALAVQFMADGWSTRRLVRRLVLTRAYGLASAYDARNQEIDPENALVWRAAGRRLDAEAIRDAMLAVAGKLEAAPQVGSLVARVGDGQGSLILRFGQSLDQLNVRSVYLPVVRDHLPDALAAFDFAEPSLVTGQRATTSVPSQSLYLMNSPFVINAAEAAASRLAREVPDERQRVRHAYLAVLNRTPAADEQAAAERFLNDHAATMTGGDEPGPAARRDAWTAFVQALLGSAEFLYLN